MRIRFAPIILLALVGIPCFSQSNTRVDALLSQVQAKADIAAYIVLAGGGEIQSDTTPEAAYALALEKRWLPSSLKASDSIAIDQLSALVMRAFDLKGGLMYSIFPGPRYAYRELVAKGFVNGGGSAHRYVPGDEVLQILRLVMDSKGGQK